MYKDEEYYKKERERIWAEMGKAKRAIDTNIPTVEKAEASLSLHLEQLQRLGATLEDSVCEILRGVIEQAKAKEELSRLQRKAWEYQDKLDELLSF